MKPVDIVFQAISDLTGGFINDATTLVVAMVCIGFICACVDQLKGFLDNRIDQMHKDIALKNARYARSVYENQNVDSTIRDMYKAKYRAAIRKAAE